MARLWYAPGMNADRIVELISFSLLAHDKQSKAEYKRFRIWDKKTPYGIHPAWCALTLLTETGLPESLRVKGAEALLLHDILEDTDAGLPACSDDVAALVKELTFENAQQSMELIFERSEEVQLMKLYDTVSNVLDGSWLTAEKRAVQLDHIRKLTEVAQNRYGELNIVRIARALLEA